jgi:hypothetical protein
MAMGAYSQITNSSIHHGLGIGLQITAANNILLATNVFFSFVRFGMNIESSSNITIDGNMLASVFSRGLAASDNTGDVDAGISACAYNEGDYCTDIYLLNNIVAGTTTAAFVAMGHECGVYNVPIFYNNTAHSIKGNGAQIFKHPADKS